MTALPLPGNPDDITDAPEVPDLPSDPVPEEPAPENGDDNE